MSISFLLYSLFTSWAAYLFMNVQNMMFAFTLAFANSGVLQLFEMFKSLHLKANSTSFVRQHPFSDITR